MTRPLLKDAATRRYRLARRPELAIQPCAPRVERRNCQGRLLAALITLVGDGCEVEEAGQRPWCSATFVGTQHRIALRMTGEGAAERARTFASRISEEEIALVNHVVVDIAVDAVLCDDDELARVMLAALTIEDW